MEENEKCPKCGSPLGLVEETRTGRKLQRCSTAGPYDPRSKPTGCTYVKWLPVEPEQLDEKCPKCGNPLVMATTRFGKKMKKCRIGGTTEKLDEKCPECGNLLVLYTTANGKRMKKCSTAGWDAAARKATGCTYIEWLK